MRGIFLLDSDGCDVSASCPSIRWPADYILVERRGLGQGQGAASASCNVTSVTLVLGLLLATASFRTRHGDGIEPGLQAGDDLDWCQCFGYLFLIFTWS